MNYQNLQLSLHNYYYKINAQNDFERVINYDIIYEMIEDYIKIKDKREVNWGNYKIEVDHFFLNNNILNTDINIIFNKLYYNNNIYN